MSDGTKRSVRMAILTTPVSVAMTYFCAWLAWKLVEGNQTWTRFPNTCVVVLTALAAIAVFALPLIAFMEDQPGDYTPPTKEADDD